VNPHRLLAEINNGSLAMPVTWRRMLAPATLDAVMELAEDAGRIAEDAGSRLGLGGDGTIRAVSTADMANAISAFHFPDDVWAKVVFDLVVAARDAGTGEIPSLDALVAALVPIYFGRVGSFIVENRDVTTEQAEERVERQAREFELLKPYLVKRWAQAASAAPAEVATGTAIGDASP
jgi:hypothetical protein